MLQETDRVPGVVNEYIAGSVDKIFISNARPLLGSNCFVLLIDYSTGALKTLVERFVRIKSHQSSLAAAKRYLSRLMIELITNYFNEKHSKDG